MTQVRKRKAAKRGRGTTDRVSSLAAKWLQEFTTYYDEPYYLAAADMKQIMAICASALSQDQQKRAIAAAKASRAWLARQ